MQGRRRRSYSGHGRRCGRRAQAAAVAFQQSPPQAQQRRRRQYRPLLRGSCCSLFWRACSASVCTGTEGMTSVCQSGGTGCLTAHRIGDWKLPNGFCGRLSKSMETDGAYPRSSRGSTQTKVLPCFITLADHNELHQHTERRHSSMLHMHTEDSCGHSNLQELRIAHALALQRLS